MDMRMKLKISSGGVTRGNNGREKMSFFRPGKYRLTGGLKKTIKQEPAFIKKLPEFLWDSKTDMMETGSGEIIFHFLHPLIGKNFTTGIAKAGFAGVGHNDILIGVLWTSILMITQRIGITAREHSLHCADNTKAKRVSVLG